MKRFENQYALVTGAAGGIGQAIVDRLRTQGAKVATADRTSMSIEAEAHLEGDLTDNTYCDNLAQAAFDALGGLTIVVNNAGIITRGDVTTTSDADYERSLAVNVSAPFRICRAAIPLMAANGGGAIVNTASCWGVHPGLNHPVYCMTKSAIASLTQCMGRDHAHQGIRINAVCPNEVDTPMIRTGFEIRGLDAQSGIDQLNQSVPIGRIADPYDIADVVCFLASDEARYMCGSLVEVNGGKSVG